MSHSVALALGTPITDATAAFVEFAGVMLPEFDDENLFTTIGLAHTVDPSLVLDASVVVGMSPEAADWQALIGLTKNFGRPSRSKP